ncbi:MAG: hypothetical protein IT195_02185 [Microthrixaceae bacterium]|nr:hypothetical protein [Microthrixaceae bacterium]
MGAAKPVAAVRSGASRYRRRTDVNGSLDDFAPGLHMTIGHSRIYQDEPSFFLADTILIWHANPILTYVPPEPDGAARVPLVLALRRPGAVEPAWLRRHVDEPLRRRVPRRRRCGGVVADGYPTGARHDGSSPPAEADLEALRRWNTRVERLLGRYRGRSCRWIRSRHDLQSS